MPKRTLIRYDQKELSHQISSWLLALSLQVSILSETCQGLWDQFTVINHDIFLVGVQFPVRLDTNFFSVRQPKYDGNLRFLYKIQEDKIEREDMAVSFQSCQGQRCQVEAQKDLLC
ncbi:hypothetical protein CEXT_97291 [Caerostris extrusa]|uniref:Uncharacterized protein n=1 Tax=Caerostris extrusa TaxID=172846 RepID=A0AAV4NG13_CAEEX|nr:hypothetical protein CEXT_97291 [Caerostris extrusa]